MLHKLFVLEWKSFVRSSDFGKGLAVRLLLGFIALYFLISFLSVGIALHYLLEDAYPEMQPIALVNDFLLAWFSMIFLSRMIFQKLPVMNVKPLLAQNIGRGTLAHYTLLKSSYAFNNWLAVVMFVPFVVVTANQTAWTYQELLPWLVAVLGFEIAINYFALYMQSTAAGGIRKVIPVMVIVLVLVALDYFGIFSISSVFGQYFQEVLRTPILALLPLLLVGSTYGLLFKDVRQKLYLDASLGDRQEKARAIDLSWTSRFGAIAPFLQLDMNLLWRTKRARNVSVVALLFLAYGLLFYPDEDINAVMYVFVGIFITGIFIINYGQFVPSWDGSYYSLLMTLPFSMDRYLESKALLMYLSVGIMLVLSTPYVYFGWEILGVHLACAVYNMGVNVPLILYFGSWNKKRIDLNNGNYFNYQGTGAAQWLVTIPILFGPLLIWGLAYWIGNFTIANGFLFFLGLGGLLMRRSLLSRISARYQENKYQFISAFSEND